jgi:hypothetical protein
MFIRTESIIDRAGEEWYDYIKIEIEISKVHRFRRKNTLG